MTMKTLSLRDKDLTTLRHTFRRFPAVLQVRVFGSRATGQARRASDIDLAVSAPRATPREWAEIRDALENAPIIYELDVVRPEQTDNPRLKEKIEREGIIIHPAATAS
jgi:predicted nucleotidyltransferase